MSFSYSASHFNAQPSDVSPAEVTVGMEAPDFTLSEADGGVVHLAALSGKPVLLIFFRRDW